MSGYYHQDERDQAANIGCLVLFAIFVSVFLAGILAAVMI